MPQRPLIIFISVSLVATLILGMGLQWAPVFKASSLGGFTFVNLRYAHAHGGFYGVLLPGLLWLVASRQRGVSAGPFGVGIYALLTALSVGLLAQSGYSNLAILASAGILLFGIGLAWRITASGSHSQSWLDVCPPGVLLTAALIPPIVWTAGENEQVSSSLTRLFMTALLLCVCLPAAWSAAGMRRRYSRFYYLALAFGTALFLTYPATATTLGQVFIVVYGLVCLHSVLADPISWLLKGSLLLFCGMLFAAAWLEPGLPGSMRIAGLHFILLGPVMHGLARFIFARKLPIIPGVGYYLPLLTLTAAMAAGPEIPGALQIQAVSGTLFTFSALGMVVYLIFAKTVARGPQELTTAAPPPKTVV
jgi:hypothetical protein